MWFGSARAARVAGALTSALVLLAPPAEAHQSTPGCNSNGLVHTVTEDRTSVRNGEAITYAVAVGNLGTASIPACDLSNVTVSVTLPGLDGQPSGAPVVVAQGVALPAGTPLTVVGTLAHTVNVNPGVTHLVVRGDVIAALHDAVVDDRVTGHKTLSASVTHPSTTLTVTPSVPAGEAPLDVTFTYRETNASPTGTPLTNVAITDDLCGPVTATGGDTNANGVLEAGETWIYTCTRRFEAAGAFTSSVTGNGRDAVDGRPAPLEKASAMVTVVGPAAPPPPEVLGLVLPRTS
jgi:uncharacterized repeat protein (TIGR01451 family)